MSILVQGRREGREEDMWGDREERHHVSTHYTVIVQITRPKRKHEVLNAIQNTIYNITYDVAKWKASL